MHICGHKHRHHVALVDGTYPYYEIETDSIIDYPQEARVLEVYHDAGTGSFTIQSRIVSHMEAPTTLSQESFNRAEIDATSGGLFKDAGTVETWDSLFADAAKSAGVPLSPITADLESADRMTAEEKYGQGPDRDFRVVVRRPPL
jgi:hypothetical protein